VDEVRKLVLEVLVQCEENRMPSDPVLIPKLAISGFSDVDRRFAKMLVQTTHRWRGRADRVLDRRLHKGIRSLNVGLLNVLRLGYIQLFHLDQIPPHAAVNTSVDLAWIFGTEGQVRLVNRILRGLATQPPTPDLWTGGNQYEALAGELSHPAWLLERWVPRWGEERVRQICQWNNQPPGFHIHLCGDGETKDEVTSWLAEKEIAFEPGALLPKTIRVKGSFRIQNSPLITEGMVIVQDESQMLVGHLWPDSDCGPVYDMCAAPGTKTSLLAGPGATASVFASDQSIHRVSRIRDTKTRLGLDQLYMVVADGGAPPFGRVFKRVLVDAPCSGLGVLRRRPDARWLRSPGEISDAASLQKHLLDSASQLVLPGGWLIYSLCSLETEEAEGQVARFLAKYPEFRPAPLPEWLPDSLRMGDGLVRVMPGEMGMEGMFAAVMQRSADAAM